LKCNSLLPPKNNNVIVIVLIKNAVNILDSVLKQNPIKLPINNMIKYIMVPLLLSILLFNNGKIPNRPKKQMISNGKLVNGLFFPKLKKQMNAIGAR
jgi:hypothetical protein